MAGACQARRWITSRPGVILHRDGRVLFANRKMHLLLGREPASMEGAALEEIVRAEELTALRDLGYDPELPRELPLLSGDGSTVWVEASGARVSLGGGAASQICVIDVSARREAEEQRGSLPSTPTGWRSSSSIRPGSPSSGRWRHPFRTS